MTAPLHIIILAAGQGTRRKSAKPKVLHPVAGQAMLGHVIHCARCLNAAGVHVVIGHGADQVRSWAEQSGIEGEDLHWVEQSEQLGTGHAVNQAMPGIPDSARVLVLYGDVPLTRPETLTPLVEAEGLCLLSVRLDDPTGYGRILRDGQNQLSGIVEQKDAVEGKVRHVTARRVSRGKGRSARWPALLARRRARADCAAGAAVRRRGPS